MVDVIIQILHCDIHPPKYHLTEFDIKTFWCKDKRIIWDKDDVLKPVSLPVLPLRDYHEFVNKGEDVAVFIEVSFCHNDDLSNPKKCDKFVGVAVTTINEQVDNPHLNPMWQFLSIDNVLRNTTEGKLYVKISAVNLCSHIDAGGKSVDYFSTSSRSNPALVCPPHLVDHISLGQSNGEEFSSKSSNNNGGNRPPKPFEIKKVPSDTEHDKVWEQKRPEYLPVEYRSPKKPDSNVAHNTCDSPDFPFKIPALMGNEAENQRRRMKKMARADGDNYPNSPPLFAYTPKTPKVDKNRIAHAESENSTEQGSLKTEPSYISNNVKQGGHDRGPLQKPHDEIEEILLALNESFDKTMGHKVEQIKEKQAKQLLNERKSNIQNDRAIRGFNYHPPTKDVQADKDTAVSKVKWNRNPSSRAPAPTTGTNSSKVPGLTIKKYVPPATKPQNAHNLPNPNAKGDHSRAISSRIAANFS